MYHLQRLRLLYGHILSSCVILLQCGTVVWCLYLQVHICVNKFFLKQPTKNKNKLKKPAPNETYKEEKKRH